MYRPAQRAPLSRYLEVEETLYKYSITLHRIKGRIGSEKIEKMYADREKKRKRKSHFGFPPPFISYSRTQIRSMNNQL